MKPTIFVGMIGDSDEWLYTTIGQTFMTEHIKAEDLPSLIGEELDPSPWLEITQERVNQFAAVTNDHQFIHVDPEKAAQTPFGGPIAHGFLSLSLLSYLNAQSAVIPENLATGYSSIRSPLKSKVKRRRH